MKITCFDRYISLMEAMQPDWFEPLNDADTDGNSSKKRIAKSLAASSSLFDNCLEAYKNSEVNRFNN